MHASTGGSNFSQTGTRQWRGAMPFAYDGQSHGRRALDFRYGCDTLGRPSGGEIIAPGQRRFSARPSMRLPIILILMLFWLGLAGHALANGDGMLAGIYVLVGILITAARLTTLQHSAETGLMSRRFGRRPHGASSRSSAPMPMAHNAPTAGPMGHPRGSRSARHMGQRQAYDQPRELHAPPPPSHGRGRPWRPSDLVGRKRKGEPVAGDSPTETSSN